MGAVRTGRLVLMIVAGVVGLLCLGGAGVALVAYRDATEPDRSAPDVAVSNYLRAMFVDRNDTQARLFICGGDSRLGAIEALRNEVEQREADFDVEVRVSWGVLTRSKSAIRRELVETELTVASFANGEARGRRLERWEFDVIDSDGWRVCEARKL